MDETTNTASAVESTFETDTDEVISDTSGWDEAWGDDAPASDKSETKTESPASETTEEKPEPAKEQSADEASKDPATEKDAPKEESEESRNQTFELKHLGETKAVGRDEVITLAQKGLDYDHVKETLATAQKDVKKLGDYESVLKSMAAKVNQPVEDFIYGVKASILAEKEHISQDVALERIKHEQETSALKEQLSAKEEAEKKIPDTATDQKRQKEILDFVAAHKDVKPETIPKEVWTRVVNNMSLSDSYDIYEAKMLRDENQRLKDAAAAKEQNEKNAARSTGSRTTSGNAKSKDDWVEAWDATD